MNVGDTVILEQLIRYRIESIKRGGMAYVYLMRREYPQSVPPTSRWRDELAAKSFDETQILDRQFERELNVWLDLDVPNVVPLLSVSSLYGKLIAFMPTYSCSLADILLRYGRVQQRAVLTYVRSVAECLSAAYERHGVLHLDLKPSNLLLLNRTSLQAHVSDWGVAQIIHRLIFPRQRRWSSDLFVSNCYGGGTLPYMSPQRLNGEHPDVRDDIYSIGLIVCELLSGSHPVQGTDSDEIAGDIMSGAYFDRANELISSADRGLRQLAIGCMHPLRKRRYHNYYALLKALESCEGKHA